MASSSSSSMNHNNLEDKSIQDLVGILRRTCQFTTLEQVEDVLVSRDMRLRQEIHRLQQKVDIERQKLHFESLSRIQTEEKFRKREEFFEKEKTRLEESYESLLKEVLELRKMKEKWEEDRNEVGALRKMVGDFHNEFMELRKLKKKWLDDSVALDDVKRKVRAMENDRKDEDAHHSVGVAAGIQLQNKGDASSSKGTMKPAKNIEIINVEDDYDECMPRRVHEKKAVSGIAKKTEDPAPSSSVAWQHANPIDMVKRKLSFSDSESSSSSSSDDSLFLDNIGISHAKKRKM